MHGVRICMYICMHMHAYTNCVCVCMFMYIWHTSSTHIHCVCAWCLYVYVYANPMHTHKHFELTLCNIGGGSSKSIMAPSLHSYSLQVVGAQLRWWLSGDSPAGHGFLWCKIAFSCLTQRTCVYEEPDHCSTAQLTTPPNSKISLWTSLQGRSGCPIDSILYMSRF